MNKQLQRLARYFLAQTGSDAAFKTAIQRQMPIRTALLTARIVENPVH